MTSADASHPAAISGRANSRVFVISVVRNGASVLNVYAVNVQAHETEKPKCGIWDADRSRNHAMNSGLARSCAFQSRIVVVSRQPPCIVYQHSWSHAVRASSIKPQRFLPGLVEAPKD